jgi:hypothetical protein
MLSCKRTRWALVVEGCLHSFHVGAVGNGILRQVPGVAQMSGITEGEIAVTVTVPRPKMRETLGAVMAGERLSTLGLSGWGTDRENGKARKGRCAREGRKKEASGGHGLGL